MVEAAIVIPVLFLLLLTMIDFADWAFQVSQANGAARDGARVGIIHYQAADQPLSSDVSLIKQAITKRIVGQSYTLAYNSGAAQCVQPHTNTVLTGTPNPCQPAIAGCDRLDVKVTWTRTPWSPLGAALGLETVHGEAIMTIVGAPVDTGTTIGSADQTGCP